jgi:hypothetical protein
MTTNPIHLEYPFLSKCKTKRVRAQSLVSIEPEHIIIDELHLVLHICDKLLRNLILDTKTLDDKNTVHGEKSDFLGQLTEKIRRD